MPDTRSIAVSVAGSDAHELQELSGSLSAVMPEAEEATIDVRSLDGDTVAVIVVLLGHRGISLLAKWLVARAQARKPTTVSARGIRIEANSVEDVERIMELLDLKTGKKDKKHHGGAR